MRGRYIDFISSYCDRWCERCGFTDRCSLRAVEIAMEMCDGDLESALELAVGAPPPRTAAEAKRREEFAEEIASYVPTEEELEASVREEEARRERIEELPLTTASYRVRLLSTRWLGDHAERCAAIADAAFVEALQVARWDSLFIHVKLRTALRGRDEWQHGVRDEPRIQNDWNGSAKVALISITRSTTAWELIAEATKDPDAAQVAAELRTLMREMESAFPDAWRFKRPGFDDRPGIVRGRRRGLL